jgi:hypothetical protein
MKERKNGRKKAYADFCFVLLALALPRKLFEILVFPKQL